MKLSECKKVLLKYTILILKTNNFSIFYFEINLQQFFQVLRHDSHQQVTCNIIRISNFKHSSVTKKFDINCSIKAFNNGKTGGHLLFILFLFFILFYRWKTFVYQAAVF